MRVVKNFELPALYPITDCRISDLSHRAQVERLIAGGARIVQMREKHLSPREFYREAVAAVEIAKGRNVKIIINDRVDVALAVKADGVHLGQTDLPPDAARRILGEAAIIGFSTHNLAQAIEAADFPLDYIAVGPIFPTSTKEKPDAVVGLENLRIIKNRLPKTPLVAIGGITRENARFVIEAGANAVAVIGALLKDAAEITAATNEFNAILR